MMEPPVEIEAQTFSLAQAGVKGDVVSLSALLAESFQGRMGVDLAEGALTVAERIKYEDLLSKYQADSWNLQGVWP